MKVINRDANIVEYNPEKIRIAIQKANNEVSRKEKATDDQPTHERAEHSYDGWQYC